MKRLYYDYEDLQKYISYLSEKGYDCIQTWEGCLGIGTWLCLPPDDKHYCFVIHEEYANEWSSRHWMMKCRKLPKQWEEEYQRWEQSE